jgi:hypothetical protein
MKQSGLPIPVLYFSRHVCARCSSALACRRGAAAPSAESSSIRASSRSAAASVARSCRPFLRVRAAPRRFARLEQALCARERRAVCRPLYCRRGAAAAGLSHFRGQVVVVDARPRHRLDFSREYPRFVSDRLGRCVLISSLFVTPYLV